MYLNFDMVGSPNHVFFVYDGDNSDAVGAGPGPDRLGGDREDLRAVLLERSAWRPREPISTVGRITARSSPTASRPAASSPGLRGSEHQRKPPSGVARPASQYDPCYHLVCDIFTNVNLSALSTNSDAMAFAILNYALNTADVHVAQALSRSSGDHHRDSQARSPTRTEVHSRRFQSAAAQLARTRPDRLAAVGNLEGATGDLEAAVKEGMSAAPGQRADDGAEHGGKAVRRRRAISMRSANNGGAKKIAEANGYLG